MQIWEMWNNSQALQKTELLHEKKKKKNPDEGKSKWAACCNRGQVKSGRVFNWGAVIWILWWDDVTSFISTLDVPLLIHFKKVPVTAAFMYSWRCRLAFIRNMVTSLVNPHSDKKRHSVYWYYRFVRIFLPITIKSVIQIKKNNPYTPSVIQEPPTEGRLKMEHQEDTPLGYGLAASLRYAGVFTCNCDESTPRALIKPCTC